MRTFAHTFIALPLFLGCLGVLGLAACSEAQAEPDVVVIMVDTLRPDHLGFLGHEKETAPGLALLAKEGAVFQRAWSTSTWTAPSVASLFTGMIPPNHGVVRGFFASLDAAGGLQKGDSETASMPIGQLPAAIPTLSELFQGAGYRTLGVASNVNIGSEIGFDRGFDRFERAWGASAEQAIGALQTWPEIDTDQPRFLYVHLNDVHWPYGRSQGHGLVPIEDRDAVRSAYDGGIGYVDHWIGRLLDGLNLDDDAIVVVLSDHGEEFWEHGSTLHGFSLHSELARVLFLLHAPGHGVQAGTYGEDVSLVDVAPTLLQLAGIALPSHLEGRSLVRILEAGPGGNAQSRALSEALGARSLVTHRLDRTQDDGELWGVLRDGWRLIKSAQWTKLYRVDTDPFEAEDVAAEHPDVVERLSREIEQLKASAGAAAAPGQVDLSPELFEHLRAIGYTD